MRACPSDAKTILLLRRMQGRYSFGIMEIARTLKVSKRTAQYYLDRLKQLGVVELTHRDSRLRWQYKLRRNK